jgi:hypothetical protein
LALYTGDASADSTVVSGPNQGMDRGLCQNIRDMAGSDNHGWQRIADTYTLWTRRYRYYDITSAPIDSAPPDSHGDGDDIYDGLNKLA